MTQTGTSLRRAPSNLIGGEWIALTPGDGAEIVSRNPAHPSEVVWRGVANLSHVARAVHAARAALPGWARLPRAARFAVLRRFQQIARAREPDMFALIRDEIGKVPWEARGEASILSAKVDITLDESDIGGLHRVREFDFWASPGRVGRCTWRPHGVMGVIGPFNFPAHLPNGHIVPALAMGNTVVFKPSDKAPGVGQLLAEFFDEALDAEGIPPLPGASRPGSGVLNLVQGGADVAAALTTHPDIDGILFTGSWPVGRRILEANLDSPGRIVALELGGNNAAVVMPDADLRQAAIEIVRCAFNTTGQRCTCTRRAVIHKDIAGRLIPAMCKAASNLIVGDPRSSAGTPIFMGPIISGPARDAVLESQSRFAHAGGRVLLESTAPTAADDGWYITPGILEVPRFSIDRGDAGCDVEVFGPLLRVTVVDSLEQAIAQSNATRYGLAASIFTKDAGTAEQFLFQARAGCVNVNTGTAGASSKLPFGGLGLSGNHRPAGSFSLDYCAYPVAGMVEHGDAATLAEGMRFEDSWL
ncbi:MAG: aldehyde dehydrogenase family protein [Phycisphaerales bacterium]